MDSAPADRASQRGETWNDTETIDRHRSMTPAVRVAAAVQVSRAALRFAAAGRGDAPGKAAFAPDVAASIFGP